MGSVFLDGEGRFGGFGSGGGFGAREVDLPVGGAGEDVGAAKGGVGDGVDGGSMGGEGVDEAGREGGCCRHFGRSGEARGGAKAAGMVK